MLPAGQRQLRTVRGRKNRAADADCEMLTPAHSCSPFYIQAGIFDSMKPAHFLGDSLGAYATSPKMPGMTRATRYDLQPLIDRQTELTIPLADED